jgi:hypothetical protein
VVDAHVEVGELPAAHEIEAIECRLRALADERPFDVVARDLGAEREGLGRDGGSAPALDVQQAEVEGAATLALELVVIDGRGLPATISLTGATR